MISESVFLLSVFLGSGVTVIDARNLFVFLCVRLTVCLAVYLFRTGQSEGGDRSSTVTPLPRETDKRNTDSEILVKTKENQTKTKENKRKPRETQGP